MNAKWIFFALTAINVWGQVTFDRILDADKEPQNWLTYSGTTLSQRHSLLTQITAANVKNLELQWIFQAQSLEKFEATPLVVDGQRTGTVISFSADQGRRLGQARLPRNTDESAVLAASTRGPRNSALLHHHHDWLAYD